MNILKNYCLLLFCYIPAYYAGDTVTVNINGNVTASTCNLETTSLNFNFGDVVLGHVSGLGSGKNTVSGSASNGWDSLAAQEVSFDCPSGLLLQWQLGGTAVDGGNYNIASNIPGFAFELAYNSTGADYTTGNMSSIVFSASGWRNILSSANYGNSTTATSKLGTNTVWVFAKIVQYDTWDASTVAAANGALSGMATIEIQYTN